MNINIIMLCGGLGTRISNVTTIPKCLIKIQKNTILDLNINAILNSNIDLGKIFINVRPNAKSQILSTIAKYNDNDDLIEIVAEKSVKGTAGTVSDIASKNEIKNGYLVIYGDQFYPDLENFLKKINSFDNMILCYEGTDYKNSGVITKDSNNCMTKIIEKPESIEGEVFLMNSGIYFLNNNFLKELILLRNLSKEEVIDFSKDIFTQINFNDHVFKIFVGKQPLAVDNEERFIQNKASI